MMNLLRGISLPVFALGVLFSILVVQVPTQAAVGAGANNLYLPVILAPPPPCSIAPTLVEPANGSFLNTLVPLYKWTNPRDTAVTEYGLEVAKDWEFTQKVYSSWSKWGVIEGNHTVISSYNLSPATTFYWRTYIQCGESLKIYSSVWSFSSGSGGTLPGMVMLQEPTDGAVFDSYWLRFRWAATPGANYYVIGFDDPIYRSGYISVNITTTDYTTWLRPNTTYKWYVKARNSYGWSNSWMLRTFTTGSNNIQPLGYAGISEPGARLDPKLDQMNNECLSPDGCD